MIVAAVGIALAAMLALAYFEHAYWSWVAAAGIVLLGWAAQGIDAPMTFTVLSLGVAVTACLFGVLRLRRTFVTRGIMKAMARVLPRLSETERIALEAGTVWWDRELFSGRPDWTRLLDFQSRPLSRSEREFLDGPVEELCGMLNDWDIVQQRELSKDVWDFLKEHRFFGMIIPEEHGGLGLSALAHSAVITKIASRSVSAAVTVMVPNSLGPAELLLHYGTDEQKSYFLPRLARGEEIPCFALTEPEAGSDAAATQSTGVLERGAFRGQEVLGIRLNWEKRYITLAPIATLIGLAFRLRDPESLLGDTDDLGITCALIPSDLPGISIGDRHDPMGVPFHNGPITGRDVFVPLDFVIGGRDGIGQGWRMLMESLAAGRSISLPALAVSAAEVATRVVSAYAIVREQFARPIAQFEGVEEPLARIAGHTYLMDAARTLTCGALDEGERPAVLSAIVKAYLTDSMRAVVTDAMDVLAGVGIMRGPRNTLAQVYAAVPIGITVEGANILTRSMIVYGQGATRSHPFVAEEIAAIHAGDLERFDRLLFGHLGWLTRNIVRTLLLGLSGGRLAPPPTAGPMTQHFRRLTHFSAAFALISDAAMISLGGNLKRKEKISGRLADALAWMYLGSAALKRFFGDGQPPSDRPLVDWACAFACYKVQEALRGVLDNLPSDTLASILRLVVFPLGGRLRPPSDRLGAAVVRRLVADDGTRLRLTKDIAIPPRSELGLGRLEAALVKAIEVAAVKARLRKAVQSGLLARAPDELLANHAVAAGVISPNDREQLREADNARVEAIQVDAFAPEAYRSLHG